MNEEGSIFLVFVLWLIYGLIPLGIIEGILVLFVLFVSINLWFLLIPVGIYLTGALVLYGLYLRSKYLK